jgi:hypothetical protein
MANSGYAAPKSSIVRGCAKREVRRHKNCALNARNRSGASFLPKTAQDEILLASVWLGSSYSPKASHCQKLDFLARTAQITAAVVPAQARDHKEIGP